MKRVILLILDGLGIGAMNDLKEQQRLQDQDADTLGNVLKKNKDLKLLNLNRLGLKAAYNLSNFNSKKEADNSKNNFGKQNLGIVENDKLKAAYTYSGLSYDGADTFMGHQEIMGSSPTHPKIQPFKEVHQKVKKALEIKGYQVNVPDKKNPYLLVDNMIVVADNIEADYGQIYNVSGSLEEIDFEEILKIGKIVRENVKVSRVIALGGKNTTSERIINSIENANSEITGVNSTASGVYGEGYRVIHLGYGIDHKKQITSILAENGIDVRLIGKVQDVIYCPKAKKLIPAVATKKVLDLMLTEMGEANSGLIAVNVQETDLAGHQQSPQDFARILKIVDQQIPKILDKIREDDLFIITADHGDDPTIGHSHHTRENVPLLVYKKGLTSKKLPPRQSLADIAATIADYFDVKSPESGDSFL
ncbi:MAG: phosphopentomutase [Halanaerobium sp.]